MPDMLPAIQDNTELLKQQDQHQYEIAKLNIEKNCENNAMWAAHWFKMRMLSLVFICFFIVIILSFCCVPMWLNHADIAIRIIEGFIIFAAGNGTGYAFKTHLVKLQEKQQQLFSHSSIQSRRYHIRPLQLVQRGPIS